MEVLAGPRRKTAASGHHFDPPLHLGLVGIGKIARDQHLPTLRALTTDFALTATASWDARLDDIAGYDDLPQMLAGETALDAVSICTPPAGRDIITRTAIAAGLHVMLEKPPAATLGGLASLEAQARQAGVTLFATWHAREAPAVLAAGPWLSARRIDAVRVRWLEDVRIWHPGQDWILAAGGFGVFDPAINAFSILTHLLSEPVVVISSALSRPSKRDVPMAAEICAESGGAPITILLDFLHSGAPCWDIEFDSDGQTLSISRGGHAMSINGVPQPLGAVNEYAGLYREFAALIAAGESQVDASPLRMVADALLIGSWRDVPDFEWNQHG